MGRRGRDGPFFGSMPACCSPGPRGTRPHPGSLALAALGPFAVCRAHSRPLSRPARALRCPRSGSFGLRLPLARHRCAGEPVPRLAALPVGRGAARCSGPGGPPRSLAAPGLRPPAARAPVPSGARCGCGLGCLRPALCRVGRACLPAALLPPWPPVPGCAAPPRRACLPRSSRRGARRLRGGCSPPLFGSAAAARPARRDSAAAG